MPQDYYAGWSEADLLTLLRQLQTAAAKGQIISTSGAGVSTARQPAGGSNNVDRQILRVLYALHLRNAEDWPDDPYAAKINRVAPSYIE